MACLGFEPWAADGRRRQYHGAMEAAQTPSKSLSMEKINRQSCVASFKEHFRLSKYSAEK